MELRHHRLYLSAVQHTHKYRFNHIVIVMPERYLVTAEALCIVIQMTSPHPRTKITGRFFNVINRIENVRLEYLYRYFQLACVLLDNIPVCRAVAWVHYDKFHLERKITVAVKLLKQLSHQHRILTARNTYGDTVVFLYKLILLYSLCECRPYLFAELLLQALLDTLRNLVSLLLLHYSKKPGGISARKRISVIAHFR